MEHERHLECWKGTCHDYIPIEAEVEKLKTYEKAEIIEMFEIQIKYSRCITDALRHREMSRLEDRERVLSRMKKYGDVFERQIKQLEKDMDDPWLKSIHKAWEDRKDLF